METDFLRTFNTLARSFTPLVAPLTALLRETGHRRIIDLCSGGGGLVLPLREAVARSLGEPVDLVLTDLFPNPTVLDHLPDRSRAGITYLPESIDACAVPDHLTGVRTISLGLHHLRPPQVQAVFADAARSRQPIVIFEGTARSIPLALGMTMLPLAVAALGPLSRPRSLRRLALHTLLPVIPLAVGWDGVCSCVRSYEPDDLKAIVEPLQTPDYGFRVGRERWLGVPITWVIGSPRTAVPES